MRISYISDIHLPLKTLIRAGTGPLFIAGDIGNPRHPSYKEFLYKSAAEWSDVYFVTGNHEYDGTRSEMEMEDIDDHIQNIAAARPNLHFVSPGKVYSLEDYNVIGGTLWTDSARYPKWKGAETRKRFREQEIFMRWYFEGEQTSKTIVITHHLPTRRLIAPQFLGFFAGSWASDLDYLLGYPSLWICGHSHINYTGMMDQTLVLINASQKKVDGYRKVEEATF